MRLLAAMASKVYQKNNVMLHITIIHQTKEIKFPKTKRGNAQALKFLQELKTTYLNDPYFKGNYDKIKRLEQEINWLPDFHRNRSKLCRKLSSLHKEQDQYLAANNVRKPAPLSITVIS